MLLRQTVLAGLVALASIALTNCMPQRQAGLREDKMLTVGYPGVAVRPNGTVAIATNFDMPVKDDSTVNTSEDGKTAGADNERSVIHKSYAVKPHLQVYPWATQAFYFGIGAALQKNTYQYLEHQQNFSLADPTYAEVTYESSANYVTVPFGWQPIWQNGFTAGLGADMRFYSSGSGKINNDGTAERVDTAKRDQTISAIERDEKKLFLALNLFLGWSF